MELDTEGKGLKNESPIPSQDQTSLKRPLETDATSSKRPKKEDKEDEREHSSEHEVHTSTGSIPSQTGSSKRPVQSQTPTPQIPQTSLPPSQEPLIPTKLTRAQRHTTAILDRYQRSSLTKSSKANKKRTTTFAETLFGSPLKPIVSPFTRRTLKPVIIQDFEARPPKLLIMDQIRAYPHLSDPTFVQEQHPITYSYFRESHLEQVNDLLRDNFWVGIDISECIRFPDFTIVALYKKLVVGCAFMTPEAYITYIAVHPDWRGAGIASFMLYHLIQAVQNRDVTLHVSVTNPAMILYQRFGFKAEEFILDFYNKYYPPDSNLCMHSFFMRLRR